MKTRSIILTAVSALGISAAPAFAKDGVVQKTKEAFYDMTNTKTDTVSFEEKSSAISESEFSTLKAKIDAVGDDKHKDGTPVQIEKVVVAAWSDRDYPATTPADKKLANDRANKVKDALHKLNVKNVETYTMTEKPNWFEKAFHTKDAKFKNKATNEDTSVGEFVDSNGGPKNVAVMIIRSDAH